MRRLPHRRAAPPRVWAAIGLALALGGCGGGFFVGVNIGGDGNGDGFAPDVSIVANVTGAAPGSTVRLTAAASDSDGIDEVAFFRVEGSDAVLLGSDGASPYQMDAVLPLDATGAVRFFARATDRSGDRRDSAPVTVNVLP